MKRIALAVAGLLLVAGARAESLEIGVEMTPLATQQADKADAGFENYALENAAAGGQ